MPWGLVIRVLTRVLASMFIWRTATARRSAGATPVHPAGRHAGIDAAASLRAIGEGAALGWRLSAAIACTVIATVLLTAGVTLTVLSPRWLGITMLAIALVAMLLAVVAARQVLHRLGERRRRRQEQALRGQVS